VPRPLPGEGLASGGWLVPFPNLTFSLVHAPFSGLGRLSLLGDDIGEGKSKAARQFAIVPTTDPLHSSSVTSAKATRVLGSLGTKGRAYGL